MQRIMSAFLTAALAMLPVLSAGAESPGPGDPPSIARGLHIAIIGGCHDCHTPGYAEANGKLDPSVALVGSPVGFRGPWGTTYPANLRLVAAGLDEAGFVQHLRMLKSRPPMPFFNLKEMEDRDLASLYLYIRSLGEPGDAAPDYVPPSEEPVTPYIVFAPPTMPKG